MFTEKVSTSRGIHGSADFTVIVFKNLSTQHIFKEVTPQPLNWKVWYLRLLIAK